MSERDMFEKEAILQGQEQVLEKAKVIDEYVENQRSIVKDGLDTEAMMSPETRREILKLQEQYLVGRGFSEGAWA